MIDILIKLGLSDKEAKVYLAALELGGDTAQNIAKKAGVNRATTYVISEKLREMGLMSSHEEGKKTVFVAESPLELENLLEQQDRELENRKKYLGETMNQLLAIYNNQGNKPTVRYFEGSDGLLALDRFGRDQYKKNTEIMGIIPIDIIEERFPERRRSAVDERVGLGIKSRMIYTHKNGEIPDYINEKELRNGVFLPREVFPIDSSIAIHEDWGVKVYNFIAEKPFGVLIQSPDLAKNMKYLFELAWLGAQVKQKELKSE
jgi:HTH-type transcriptional regulator, sugar sensing transcriptional regulator